MEKFTDSTPMPFGKYKGTKLANVPADYLIWLGQQYQAEIPKFIIGRSLAVYIMDNYDALTAEIERAQQ